jgi:hypothetical protein
MTSEPIPTEIWKDFMMAGFAMFTILISSAPSMDARETDARMRRWPVMLAGSAAGKSREMPITLSGTYLFFYRVIKLPDFLREF